MKLRKYTVTISAQVIHPSHHPLKEVRHLMMLAICLSSFSFVLCARFVAPGRPEVLVYFRNRNSGMDLRGIIPLGFKRISVRRHTLTKLTQADLNMVARKHGLDVYLALVHVSA